MTRKAVDAAIAATKRALIEMGRRHVRDVRMVHPAQTTMDCSSCGAITKHALPLSERTYICHRMRSRVAQGHQLRACDVPSGWSEPGWC